MIVKELINSLYLELINYENTKFSGCLEFSFPTGQIYKLYLSMGRLLWAQGHDLNNRRWYRLINKYCSLINLNDIQLRKLDNSESWHHHTLVTLVRQQIITPVQLIQITKDTTIEILFDLLQQIEITLDLSVVKKSLETARIAEITAIYGKKDLEFLSEISNNSLANICQIKAENGIRPGKDCILPNSWTLNLSELLEESQRKWEDWDQVGINKLSPNLALVIKNKASIAKKAGTAIARRLHQVAEQELTLREIANLINQNVKAFTRSLLPYIQNHDIELIPIKDLPIPSFVHYQTNNNCNSLTTSEEDLLVACVDDSSITCKMLENMITKAGYRFLGISDPTQAMISLLQHKPDIILLDLIMPIVNGYELCTQIRLCSQLQKIPIIFLSGSDQILNRVKAKFAGASQFLSKPLNAKEILDTLAKYSMEQAV